MRRNPKPRQTYKIAPLGYHKYEWTAECDDDDLIVSVGRVWERSQRAYRWQAEAPVERFLRELVDTMIHELAHFNDVEREKPGHEELAIRYSLYGRRTRESRWKWPRNLLVVR